MTPERFDAPPEAPPPHLNSDSVMDKTLEPRSYELIIRQSPKHGQACLLGSKERRVLDPFPIIQLRLRDMNQNLDFIGHANPLLVMQVHLIALQIQQPVPQDDVSMSTSSNIGQTTDTLKDHSSDMQLLPEPHDTAFSSQRFLEGKLTVSASIAYDVDEYEDTKKSKGRGQNNKSCFFCFTDLSIRATGIYKLSFSLINLGASKLSRSSIPDRITESGVVVANISSPSFAVVQPRHFAGMYQSTALAKCIAQQGAQVPIRNESKWKSTENESQSAPDSFSTLEETRE